MFRVIPREQWGARAPRSRVPVNYPTGVTLWIHHSDGRAPFDMQDEIAEIRRIQNFHMDDPDRRWNDIGYGWIAAPSGRVYEGRGAALAAHCPGKNHEPSVCLLGDYSTARPSREIHVAVYALADMLRAGDLAGHREGIATACPGDMAMSKIVNGPPPRGFGSDFDPNREPGDVTLRMRLRDAGFGPRSIDVILRRLRDGYAGTIPNPHDRETFRRLRDAGFGVASSRRIVHALRRKP